VDQEIKHVLREELEKGNQFDLNKVISVFDSQETYEELVMRYPELTDDLLHLMPMQYGKVHLGQLVSAIWSKYLSLQGGDVETQRQLLEKDRQIFQKEKDNSELQMTISQLRSERERDSSQEEYERIFGSGRLSHFIANRNNLLNREWVPNFSPEAVAFGFADRMDDQISLNEEGKRFLKWYILNKEKKK
jgi:hypothetical protein